MAANTKETSLSGESTVIGRGTLISGRVSGDEDLTVRGRIEGEIALNHTLIVESTGVVKANANVKSAIISGVVVGNIEAMESVQLTREGRMVGDIRAPRVILVEGAALQGRIEMGAVQPKRAVERVAHVSTRGQARTFAGSKPTPPPPPSLRMEGRPNRNGNGKSLGIPPGLPPIPPLLAAGAKKKVVVKKKAR